MLSAWPGGAESSQVGHAGPPWGQASGPPSQLLSRPVPGLSVCQTAKGALEGGSLDPQCSHPLLRPL